MEERAGVVLDLIAAIEKGDFEEMKLDLDDLTDWATLPLPSGTVQ